MRVVKSGICRDIDESRKQEFIEKGYSIEGVTSVDCVELLEQENEALKQENKALKEQCVALKSQIGGETNGEQSTESAEQPATRETTTKTDKTETTTRTRK